MIFYFKINEYFRNEKHRVQTRVTHGLTFTHENINCFRCKLLFFNNYLVAKI